MYRTLLSDQRTLHQSLIDVENQRRAVSAITCSFSAAAVLTDTSLIDWCYIFFM
jgi:hypothetical protein